MDSAKQNNQDQQQNGSLEIKDKNQDMTQGEFNLPVIQKTENRSTRNGFHSSYIRTTQNSGMVKSGSVTRQVNQEMVSDGLNMLEARLQAIESGKHVIQMQNRVKRLVFEQQRARKLTDVANDKADRLLEARNRHQKALEDKFVNEQIKRQEEDRARLEFLKQRMSHKQQVFQNQQMNLLKAHAVKSELISQKSAGMRRRSEELDDYAYHIQMQHNKVKQGVQKQLYDKYENKRLYDEAQRNKYHSEMDKQKGKVSNDGKRLKQLEDMEQFLIKNLGETKKQQNKALSNLHNVVQVCNTIAVLDTGADYTSHISAEKERQNPSRKWSPQNIQGIRNLA